MAGIPKYVQIAEVLQHRIAHGDYLSGALPGAPKLMQEFGISYMTTRQAMQKLIDDGTVIRAANGRLEVPGAPGNSPKLRVAYLHPSAISLADKWRNAIAGAACKYGCSYQDIPFRYSEDAVVYETLDQDFDMIFFNISPLHSLLLEKLRRRSDRMISLFNDLTCYGIRCFDGINIEAIGHLVKFLHQRGCRRIERLDDGSLQLENRRRRLSYRFSPMDPVRKASHGPEQQGEQGQQEEQEQPGQLKPQAIPGQQGDQGQQEEQEQQG